MGSKLNLKKILFIFLTGVSSAAFAAPAGVYQYNQYNEKRLQELRTQNYVNSEKKYLEGIGYHEWRWKQSNCADCDIYILPTQTEMMNASVFEFAKTISQEKKNLLKFYTKTTSQEYNLLALMAMGILGQETRFFTSARYIFKEENQEFIILAKYVASIFGKRLTPSSRGPTQIKVVPEVAANQYGVTEDNIHEPRNAAVATMCFLMNSLREMKRRAYNNHLTFITPQTYADYLPFLYNGLTSLMLKGKIRPEDHYYGKQVRRYMRLIKLYEKPEYNLSLSDQIYNNQSLSFVAHAGTGPNDTALAMNIQYEPILNLRTQLNYALNANLDFFKLWSSSGEAHVTTITPPEYYLVLKDFVSIDRINQIAVENNIQASDLKILGLGHGEAELNSVKQHTYFVIVQSENLLKIRRMIYKEFVAKGGDPKAWDPEHFYPHITVGYTLRDLHESDGVIKDLEHSLDYRFGLIVKKE